MQDYLTFRRMVTPVFIQVIFWIGVAFIVIGALATMTETFLGGIGMLLGGLLGWRVWCELVLIMFKIYERLCEMSDRTSSS